MTNYTERDVRKAANTFGSGDIYKMLTQLADMLAAREKGEPVAWRTRGACMAETVYTEWMPDEPNVAAWEPLYTHPDAQPRVPDGWMCNQAKIQELHTELQSRGWQLDSKGEPDCVDQASAMAAEVIERVLMPLLAAQESGR